LSPALASAKRRASAVLALVAYGRSTNYDSYLERLQRANSGHSLSVQRTSQIDLFADIAIGAEIKAD
jgi:hypothetical protein